MKGTHDTDDGGALEPRDAAILLERADRDARRQFDVQPPLAAMAGGIAVLVGYGALWLSVRGQDPYAGPNLGALVLFYGGLSAAVAVGVTLYQRASAGVSGPTVRQRTAEGVALLLSVLGSPLLQGALKLYGASDSIVYGVVPAAVPLIIIGSTVMGMAASRSDRRQFGAALAVVTGGIVALWVGPYAAWAVAGIGLFAGLAGYGVTGLPRRHAGA